MKFYDLLQCGTIQMKNMIKNEKDKNEKKRLIIAFILKNIFCIAFCMAVVILYTILFGAENSIAGVVVLIAILVFRFVDLGVNLKSGIAGIAIIFSIYAFLPYLSNILNPSIAIFIDFFAIMLLLIISCHNILMSNQSVVVMSYLLLQGYNVTSYQFPKRAFCLILGGAVICTIYYFKHKNKTYRRNLKDLFLEYHHMSFRGKWQLKLSLALCTIIFLGRILSFDRVMWLGFACLSVMHPDSKTMYKRLLHRPIFVFIGCIFFIAGFYILPPFLFEQIGMIGGLIVGFCGSYQWQTVFNCFGGLASAITVLGLPLAIVYRITHNLIGSVYGVLVNFLFDKIFNKVYRLKS